MAPAVEAVTEPVWLGEGPHWHAPEHALYFVSIFDRSIHRYDPATGKHTRSKLDAMPTFIIPVEGKPQHFAVGLGRKVVEVQWDGTPDSALATRTVAEVDQHSPNNRLNDAKADPRGRLFAGTMGHEYEPGKFDLKKGSLYRIDPDGSVHTLASSIDISNGLCWDERDAAFYYADSFEYTVRRYDYDVNSGEISNPRTVFSYAEHGLDGIVDGMTIDTDGNLWIANFDGSQIIKVDPRAGKLLQKVPIPALQTTSATFGGKNLDQLYVTSACMNRGTEQLPPAGSTFRVTGLGVRGHQNVSTRGHQFDKEPKDLQKGSLYRIHPDGSTHRLDGPIDIANGLCWDERHGAFYYIDSLEYAIRRYDNDIETGNISNCRLIFKMADHGLKGIADGMTIDTEGNLWIANFYGGLVIKVDPRTGKLLQKLPIPATLAASVTFGGRHLDELYVTSGCMPGPAERPPPEGETFRVTGLGVRGYDNVSVRFH